MTDASVSPIRRRPRSSALLWVLAPLVLVGALVAANGPRPWTRSAEADPPRLGRLPRFTLVERSGREAGLEALRGRTWVADFIFTRCGGVCPGMTARMARLRREAPDDVTFVSFTVDPVHDTPEVLSRYAEGFGADGRWLFLTGPQADLHRLSIEGFKLGAEEVAVDRQQAGGEGPFLHSSKFVLVDAGGEIRGYYDSSAEGAMKSLLADIGRVRSGGK